MKLSKDNEIARAFNKYWYPKNIPLSKDADVNSIEELFTDKQLAHWLFLKFDMEVKNDDIRNSLYSHF